MQVGGRFFIRDRKSSLIVPNTLVGDGVLSFMQNMFQNSNDLPANFYLGLTDADYSFLDAPLTDIAAGEPVGNGYVRQPLARNDTVWTCEVSGGMYRAHSEDAVFTASGEWTRRWTRPFLCSVVSGTSGIVYAFGKASDPHQVLSGEGPSVAYEFWWRA